MDNMLNVLKALSDETRLKIFLTLLKRRICVKGLAKTLSISEPAVSQHMKILKNAGLIVGERRGHYIHYKVEAETIKELIKAFEQFLDPDELESPLVDMDDVSKICQKMCRRSGEECME
jgi:ArsR family transcriptional regulator